MEVFMLPRCRIHSDTRALLIMTFVSAHADKPITLRCVGRELGLGKSTIRRILKAERGQRFQALVDEARVKRVLDALALEPDLKCSALALAGGWSSRTSLYSAVKRVTGKSLQELRAEMSNTCAEAPWIHETSRTSDRPSNSAG
jgi:methylphosphotriester-DNA--protein-cysteine methyltransferase